jgi:hypothetical protein
MRRRLSTKFIAIIVLGGGLHILAGCDKSGGALAAAGSLCDRRSLELSDVAAILRAPVIGTSAVPGDVQSCDFVTASFPAITVSVRPGLGHASMDAWTTGKMPFAVSPLAGVGETAVWQDTLHEVIAEKNDVLCDIQVRGGGGDIAVSPEYLPQTLGALCNKIFAGR